MDNKKLGMVLIGMGLVFVVALVLFDNQIDTLADILIEQSGGVCFLESGECIHEQSQTPIYLGIVITVAILALGIYLIFFDKSQKYLKENQEKIVERLEETKKRTEKDEKFEILLKGLNEDEKKIIEKVKEQDGIQQSTLRIRTDMSKAKLSTVLSELEEKDLIKKVPDKKTNKIFLKMEL